MNILPLIDIIEDLNKTLTSSQRYLRLIQAVKQVIPCDAISLLKLEGDYLVPVAVLGLKQEAMARRFTLANHPRLEKIMHNSQITRFAQDSELPDPFDGLVDCLVAGSVNGVDDSEHLSVHDCMGSGLHIGDELWGVLTLDAMAVGTFDSLNPSDIRACIATVTAAIGASQRIIALESSIEHNQQVAQCLMEIDRSTEIIGASRTIKSMHSEISIVAPSDLSVLITGETGVGKELVAKNIHQLSRRNHAPLVQINCAALPENIIESELFGHVKGAFSGATRDRRGRFELADGGSLFLDEVGELPLIAQAKLLRALQSGEIQRVGSDKVIKVDVRIIAATNRDLHAEVKAGRFRADLYHRLSVYPLLVPPLRERDKDYLLLAGYFLEKNQHQLGVNKLCLSKKAAVQLANYDWPGNVRELEHLLSRTALKAIRQQGKQTKIISIESEYFNLRPINKSSVDPKNGSDEKLMIADFTQAGFRETVDAFQRDLIEQALIQQKGNVASTARLLRLDRSNLVRIMNRLGFD